MHASFPCHAQHLFHPNHFCTRASHIRDRLASLFGSVLSMLLDYIEIKIAAIPFLENRITALYSAFSDRLATLTPNQMKHLIDIVDSYLTAIQEKEA